MTNDARNARIRAAAPTRARLAEDREKASPELDEILRTIDRRLFDETLSRAELKRLFGEQTDRILAATAAELGRTFESYVMEARVETGLALLASTKLSIARISRLVGYADPADFRKAMKRLTGLAPSSFRETLVKRGLAPTEAARLFRIGFRDRALDGELDPDEGRRLLARLRGEILTAPDSFEERAAEAIWEYLEPLPLTAQRQILRRHLSTSSPALFERLSDLARDAAKHDPRRAVELAKLALEGVEGAAGHLGERYAGLAALAQARLGEAQALAGDALDAEQSTSRSLRLLENAEPTVDPAVRAEILLRAGRQRIVEEREAEAQDLVFQALELSEAAGDRPLAARAHLAAATLDIHRHEPEEAIAHLRRVLTLADDDTGLHFQARRRLAELHLALGRPEQSRHESERAMEIEDVDPVDRLHLKLLAARAHRDLGQRRAAEEAYRDARRGFLELGEPEGLAEASLELAGLLVRANAEEEALELVRQEVEPVLETRRHHDGVGDLIDRLHAAAHDGGLPSELLNTVRRALRGDPEPSA